MRIAQIQKTSLIDYPAKISAIIFTQGCNLACPYCHNPELVDPKRFTPPLPEGEVIAFLKKRIGQIDAVVVTGGEPTIHGDLVEFLGTIKALGYLIKLDTNGTDPDMLRNVIRKGVADYIAMDIKTLPEKYGVVTRTPVYAGAIESSIEAIMESPVAYEFRTTLSRSLLTPADVIGIGHRIRTARLYVLQQFSPSKHVDGAFLYETGFTREELSEVKQVLDRLVQCCTLR